MAYEINRFGNFGGLGAAWGARSFGRQKLDVARAVKKASPAISAGDLFTKMKSVPTPPAPPPPPPAPPPPPPAPPPPAPTPWQPKPPEPAPWQPKPSAPPPWQPMEPTAPVTPVAPVTPATPVMPEITAEAGPAVVTHTADESDLALTAAQKAQIEAQRQAYQQWQQAQQAAAAGVKTVPGAYMMPMGVPGRPRVAMPSAPPPILPAPGKRVITKQQARLGKIAAAVAAGLLFL